MSVGKIEPRIVAGMIIPMDREMGILLPGYLSRFNGIESTSNQGHQRSAKIATSKLALFEGLVHTPTVRSTIRTVAISVRALSKKAHDHIGFEASGTTAAERDIAMVGRTTFGLQDGAVVKQIDVISVSPTVCSTLIEEICFVGRDEKTVREICGGDGRSASTSVTRRGLSATDSKASTTYPAKFQNSISLLLYEELLFEFDE